MACLFGFIATFLGSSLLSSRAACRSCRCQTLFINFTVQVALAIGLGYGKPCRPDARSPRAPDVPILSRRLIIWLIAAGLVMAVVTLGIISWWTPLYGEETARTMGAWWRSRCATSGSRSRPPTRRSPCPAPETFEELDIALAAGVAFLFIILATELPDHQHDPRHGQPDGGPVADGLRRIQLTIIVIAEVKNMLKIRTRDGTGLAPTEAASAAA